MTMRQEVTGFGRRHHVATEKSPPGTRRTHEHIIASQSYNYVEKFFIDQGHTVDRPTADYGIDLLVNTFDEDGYAEAGDIRIQLKASDQFRFSKDGQFILFNIYIKHYHHWIKQVMPVFLVLYDARKVRAYWVYVQAYFSSDEVRKPRANAKTVAIRVPVKNRFNRRTVEYMRKKKAALLEIEVEHVE
jgi:hypothetical protein